MNGVGDNIVTLFLPVIGTLLFPASMRMLSAVPADDRRLPGRERDAEPLGKDVHGNIERSAHIGLAAARAGKLGDRPRDPGHGIHRDLLLPV